MKRHTWIPSDRHPGRHVCAGCSCARIVVGVRDLPSRAVEASPADRRIIHRYRYRPRVGDEWRDVRPLCESLFPLAPAPVPAEADPLSTGAE